MSKPILTIGSPIKQNATSEVERPINPPTLPIVQAYETIRQLGLQTQESNLTVRTSIEPLPDKKDNIVVNDSKSADSDVSLSSSTTHKVKWDKNNIAKHLWQASIGIRDSTERAVNAIDAYLEKEGFELEGVPSDGDCFCHAFLGSCRSLSRKIPLIESAKDEILFLRECISIELKSKLKKMLDDKKIKEISERAKEIKEKHIFLNGLEEGCLLSRVLDLPIRIITVNEEHGQCGFNDMLVFTDGSSLEWIKIPDSQKPQECVFIIDLGGHFVYAKKAKSSIENPLISLEKKTDKSKGPKEETPCFSPNHLIAAREAFVIIRRNNALQGQDGEVTETLTHPTTVDTFKSLPSDKYAKAAKKISDHQAEMVKNIEPFEKWLREVKLKPTEVSGVGLNCLINAIIQHATGHYHQESFKEAEEIRREIIKKFPHLTGMLQDDDESTKEVLRQVNLKFGTNLNVCFIQANEEGKPAITSFNVNAEGDPVVIWNQSNHYVCIIVGNHYDVFQSVRTNTTVLSLLRKSQSSMQRQVSIKESRSNENRLVNTSSPLVGELAAQVPSVQRDFEQIKEQLNQRVQELRQLQGDVKVELERLKGLAGNRQKIRESLEKIEELEIRVEAARQKSKEAHGRHEKLKDSLQSLAKELKSLLKSSIQSYEYLNFGWGQFEEYEHDITEENKECEGEFKDLASIISRVEKLYSVEQASLREFSKKAKQHVLYIINERAYKYREKDKKLSELQELLLIFQSDLQSLGFKEKESEKEQNSNFKSPLFIYPEEQSSGFQSPSQELDQLTNGIDLEPKSDDEEDVIPDISPEEMLRIDITMFNGWLSDFIRDRKPEIRFDAQLAQREVFNALERSRGSKPSKIIDQFIRVNKGLENLFFALAAVIQNPEPDALVSKEEVNRCFSSVENIVIIIVNALKSKLGTFKNLRYDEWGSHDQFINKVLNTELKSFLELQKQLYELQLHWNQHWQSLKEYCEISKELSSSDKDYLSVQKELIKALNEFRNNPSPEVFKELPSSRLTKEQQDCLDRVIGLARKRRVEDKEKDPNLEDLEDKRATLEEKLCKQPNPQKDPLDEFIEWVRLDQRIQQLEDEFKAARQAVAQGFLSDLQNHQIDEKTNQFFVRYKSGDHELILGVRSEQRHPLDSPLIEAISILSGLGVGPSHYRNFLYFSEKEKLSLFEKGMFSVIEKTGINKLLARREDFKLQVQSVRKESQGRVAFDPKDIRLPSAPAYYKAFQIPASRSLMHSANSGNFSPLFNKLYAQLALSLAEAFVDKSSRDKLHLPEGSPVACVIVSKSGNILSWAVNTAKPDRVRHAEVNALNLYFLNHPEARFLPEGARIFTSLKCCHMCSGAIYDSLGPHKNSIKVIYCLKDPKQQHKILKGIEEKAVIEKEGRDLLKDIDERYQSIKDGEKQRKAKETLNAADMLTNKDIRELALEVVQEFRNALPQNSRPEEQEMIRYAYEFFATYSQ